MGALYFTCSNRPTRIDIYIYALKQYTHRQGAKTFGNASPITLGHPGVAQQREAKEK
jgi:hypothetical protein